MFIERKEKKLFEEKTGWYLHYREKYGISVVKAEWNKRLRSAKTKKYDGPCGVEKPLSA